VYRQILRNNTIHGASFKQLKLRSRKIPPVESASVDQVQKTRHRKTKNPIDKKEKQAREQDHENNERGGDESFAPRGPRHFAGLGADLLQEFQGVSHCLDVPQRLDIASAAGSTSQVAPPANYQGENRPDLRETSDPKTQGTESRGQVPRFVLIIKRAAKANSIF
jgi:hypothetical protein